MTHRPPADIQATLPLTGLDLNAATSVLLQLGYPHTLVHAVIATIPAYLHLPLPGGHELHFRPAEIPSWPGDGTYGIHAAAGPDLLAAEPHGPGIEAIKAIALAEARALYGEDVPLVIESVGNIHANVPFGRADRRFRADIKVRCLDLPEGFRP